jgi:hypothetical protein
MSEYLKISPGGKLTLYKYNGHEGKYRYTKVDDKFALKDRTTKEIVHTFDTEEEREAWFYDPAPIDKIWTHLRSHVFVEEGTTVKDVVDAIASLEELEALVSNLCPFFPIMRSAEVSDTPATLVVVNAQAQIHQNVLKHQVYLGFDNNRDWSEDTVVLIDNVYPIIEDGEEIEKAKYGFSLLEFIDALFGLESHPEAQFTKEGLKIDGLIDGDKIISCLFCPITIDEDVVCGDVFKFVESNETLKWFISMYSWCSSIEAFHEQAKHEKEGNDLWHLVLSRRISFTGDVELNGWVDYAPDIQAVGDISETERKHFAELKMEIPNSTAYGIGAAHMSHLVDLPFVLEDNVNIFWKSRNQTIKEKRSFKMGYTLLDFLDAIYWEISFYGGPDDGSEEMEI